ncbi:hypothetical protein CPAR01_01451 [Colletotrichum paranaense]|uniref:Uncharacterized protein n=1 Tax=Colletotrichum paranaense TaxID=1914294 RepID=A0ABQ9T731_9PEZI|nr:uncharacterized protein CPAR01_01451 [Colletotrichum paranaense]KAK1547484.1 hypothetical protein CPAR01_01451 [Colletotrichum paranaense]
MGPQISCVQKYVGGKAFFTPKKKRKKKSFHHTEKYRSRRIAATHLFLCIYTYSPSLASHHPETPPLGPCVTVRTLGKCACVCGCVDVCVSHYSGLSMTWCAEGILSVFSISDNVFVFHPILPPPPHPCFLFLRSSLGSFCSSVLSLVVWATSWLQNLTKVARTVVLTCPMSHH